VSSRTFSDGREGAIRAQNEANAPSSASAAGNTSRISGPIFPPARPRPISVIAPTNTSETTEAVPYARR
jgi:hypothetical protein